MSSLHEKPFWNSDRAADLVRAARLRGWLALGLAALVLLLVGLEGRRLYSRLPDRLPARYTLAERHESPGATYQKTPWSVFAILGLAAFALAAGVSAASRTVPGVSRRTRENLERVLSLPGPQREYAIAAWREAVRWTCALVSVSLAMMQRAMWYGALGGSGIFPYVWFISGVILGMLVVARGETLMVNRASALQPLSPPDSGEGALPK